MARTFTPTGLSLAALIVLASSLLAPTIGHAATVEFTKLGGGIVDPEAEGDARWDPSSRLAAPGDTIVWHFGANDTQPPFDLAVYATDGEYFSEAAPEGDLTRTFSGGTVWFYSTPYAGISSTGVCSGACGSYTSAPHGPSVPVITSPVDGSAIGGRVHTVSGTGQPLTIVRLKDGDTLVRQGMVTAAGTWSFQGVPFSAGSHTLSVSAIDAADRVSGSSSISFELVDDRGPSITITNGSPSMFVLEEAASIEGTAQDPSGVAFIYADIFNVFGTITNTVVATCGGPCEGSPLEWEISLVGVTPGYYQAIVHARDRWGNESSASTQFLKI